MKVNKLNYMAMLTLLVTWMAPVAAQQQQVMNTLEEEILRPQSTQKRKGLWGAWNLGLSGHSYADRTDSQSYASVGVGLKGGLTLIENLDFQAEMALVARSGFSQTRFGRDGLNDGVNVHEAILSYTPLSFIELDAGIINQRHLGSELLVSGLPFPGIRQTIQHEFSGFHLGLKAQQAIPTSRSLDTHTRREKEETPSFLTETLFAGYKPTENSYLLAQATRFRFSDLPTHVAYESRMLGNTVPHSTPASSSFFYDFRGMLYSVEGALQATDRIGLDLRAQLLENAEAPEAYNRGFLVQGGVTLAAFGQKFRATFTNFFNESDSSPAYYNSSHLGHNNRRGYSAGLEAILGQNLKISTYYTDSDVINADFSNTRQQHLTLALETVYATF